MHWRRKIRKLQEAFDDIEAADTLKMRWAVQNMIGSSSAKSGDPVAPGDTLKKIFDIKMAIVALLRSVLKFNYSSYGGEVKRC